jgi:hypothetical protein
MLAGASAQAAAPDLEAARRCTGVTDSLERLVCYDKAMASPAGVVPPQAPPGHDRSSSSSEDMPSTLDAKVAAVEALPLDVVRVTLDNGQVWEQLQANARFKVRAGDTVRVKKGLLGTYKMTRTSTGGGSSVPVRRLQ